MTDEDEYGQLYRRAIGLLPGGQPDPVRARVAAATRRRRRIRVATAMAVAISVAVIGVGATTMWWRQVSGVTAASAGGDPSPSPTCPALLPGTSDATIRYGDLLRWNQQWYVAAERSVSERRAVKVGAQVATITCSITEITAGNGNRVADDWPDGTATFLPRGTPLFAVQDVEPRCELAVLTSDQNQGNAGTKTYVAAKREVWNPCAEFSTPRPSQPSACRSDPAGLESRSADGESPVGPGVQALHPPPPTGKTPRRAHHRISGSCPPGGGMRRFHRQP